MKMTIMENENGDDMCHFVLAEHKILGKTELSINFPNSY